MTVKEYKDLEQRAKEAGVEECLALKQLLQIIQLRNKAITSFSEFYDEMGKTEQSFKDIVEEIIEQKGEKGRG